MHEVQTLADALGIRFDGDPTKLADVAGFVIQRNRRMALEAVYVPPHMASERPVLTLSAHASRERFLAIALGHHYLRHRGEDAYVYSHEGPCFSDERAALEAREFAVAFLACAPPSATVRAR